MAAATKPLAKITDLATKLAEALGIEEGQEVNLTISANGLSRFLVQDSYRPFEESEFSDADEDDDDVVDDDDADDSDDDDTDDDDADDDADDDDSDDDGEDDDSDDDGEDEEWDEDKLRAETIASLRKIAKDEFGVKNASKLKTKDALIDAIFEAAEDGDDDGDEEEGF